MSPLLNDDILLRRMNLRADIGICGMETGSTTNHTGETILDKEECKVMKDCWSAYDHGVNEEGTHRVRKWIHHHNRPRRTLFTPTGTKDGLNSKHVLQSRVTHILGRNGRKLDTLWDSWLNERDKHKVLHKTWIGTMEFYDKLTIMVRRSI